MGTWAGLGNLWVSIGLHTKEEKAKKVFDRTLAYFLSHLPESVIPYWDFDFDDPSDEPRDSSALAIVICGMFEMAY